MAILNQSIADTDNDSIIDTECDSESNPDSGAVESFCINVPHVSVFVTE